MCGISCTIHCKGDNSGGHDKNDKLEFERLDELLQHRGPDLSAKKSVSSGTARCMIELSAHVLWTQGQNVSAQPFSDDNETKFLLFNGDIYSFGTSTEAAVPNFTDHNDGSTLFKCLTKCDSSTQETFLCTFKTIIGSISGPFAFIYYDRDKNVILFGRDFFGRESLLFSESCEGSVKILSSVSVFKNVFEVPAAGIYYWDLQASKISLLRFESQERKDISSNLVEFERFLNIIDIQLHIELSSEIKLQLCTLVKPLSTSSEPTTYCSETLEKVKQCAESNNSCISKVLEDISVILDDEIAGFLHVLRKSVSLRVKCQPNFCKNCISGRVTCSCSKVAVLFSGGLDSTVLAYLALENTEIKKIDLINVAFSKDERFENIPDRETGLESYKVLKSIFEPQGKTVNFVSVDIRKEEVETMRGKVIRDLINPLTSVLDDSLGCCLWFAGRSSGVLYETNTLYTSPARVVLLGSGADELLGGYGRHRTAYNMRGWVGLTSEMQEDIDRISVRNLGRDNRIVSDHGVCPRMPYLDEDVVTYVTDSDIWIKCCPLERGLGEKLLLRASALKLLGKDNWTLAVFPKRAMQFGSRIAKLENSKEKGSDKCSRLITSV